MPRTRTGALLPPGPDGFWRCRVTQDKSDGSTWRPLYSLGTADKALAQRKLARVNAELLAGRDPFDAADRASVPERVREYAEAWLTKRAAHGVGMAEKERRTLELHALEAIGRLPVREVRPTHVRGILEEAAAAGLRRKTVSELRGVLHRLFRAALEDEAIESNPVAAVRSPKMREVRKDRAILTDEEFTRFVACAQVDLEMRMMALVARCEGGMRTGDVNRWDWTMIDRDHFAECIIPRAKTGTPQALAIPEVLAPFLRAWWDRAGKPEAGLSSQCASASAPGARRPSNIYAKRLRRELFRAGVCPREAHRSAGDRLGHAHGSRPTSGGNEARARSARPALLRDRDHVAGGLPFLPPRLQHGARRGGVNVQHAMHLAAHSDPRVHARYVMRTAAMRTVPEAALPAWPMTALVERARQGDVPNDDAPENPPAGRDVSPPSRDHSPRKNEAGCDRIVTARDDSPVLATSAAKIEKRNVATFHDFRGSDCWTRTSDPAVNSRLLYQLS